MTQRNRYDLTTEEYFECLSMADINTFGLCNNARSEHPRSIFIVAQAGAGKTGLKSFVVNEAEREGTLPEYIEFNPDEIAKYHKYYREILRDYPDDSYPILQKFVSPALDTYLRQRAVDLRFNLVQEGTFGSTDIYVEILDFQKNGGIYSVSSVSGDGTIDQRHVSGGFDIDINVLAVDRFESYLSSLEREQYFRENGYPPRVVTLKNHDYAYNKMIDTLRIIEQRGLMDRGRVFRRGPVPIEPQLVYTTGDNTYPSLAQAVIEEREKNRQEILSNPDAYYERIEDLRARIKTSGIPAQLFRLFELKKIFDGEVKKYKGKQRVSSVSSIVSKATKTAQATQSTNSPRLSMDSAQEL